MSPENAIDVRDVRKTYRGRVQALRGVSMQVRPAEIFGLLGPNGAGKSTLVKILMTVIRPSTCSGQMLGRPIGHKPTLARVGYLPEHHRFPEYLTGRQAVDFFAALSGVERATRRRRADELLDLVGLDAWQHKRVRQYSKGMRQRLGIAQALMNDPDVIILDEPTDGVDPVGRREIRSILIEQRRRGKAVFVNSHLLSELEMVCDRAAIMVKGTVYAQGTIDELTSYGVRYEVEMLPRTEGDAAAKVAGVFARLEQGPARNGAAASSAALLPGERIIKGTFADGTPIEIEGCVVRVGTTDPAAIQPIIDAMRQSGVVVKSARLLRPTLEDLFMRAVTDQATSEELQPAAHDDNAEPARRLAPRNEGSDA